MRVSRAEGYRRSVGKEGAALEVARDFFSEVVGVREPAVIVEPERNRLHGDLDLGRVTAECKSQPIDPERFDRNFVEVFEDTTKSRAAKHRDGFERTCEILSIDPKIFARLRYKDARQALPLREEVGRLEYVSCSLESIAGSDLTIYVNSDPKRTFVYVYRRAFLIERVRRQVLQGGMWRGKGRSNATTTPSACS